MNFYPGFVGPMLLLKVCTSCGVWRKWGGGCGGGKGKLFQAYIICGLAHVSTWWFYVGLHIHGLAHAASGYHRVLEENRRLYNQVQDLRGKILNFQ